MVVLQDPACTALMQEFIARNPALWNEDIGESMRGLNPFGFDGQGELSFLFPPLVVTVGCGICVFKAHVAVAIPLIKTGVTNIPVLYYMSPRFVDSKLRIISPAFDSCRRIS